MKCSKKWRKRNWPIKAKNTTGKLLGGGSGGGGGGGWGGEVKQEKRQSKLSSIHTHLFKAEAHFWENTNLFFKSTVIIQIPPMKIASVSSRSVFISPPWLSEVLSALRTFPTCDCNSQVPGQWFPISLYTLSSTQKNQRRLECFCISLYRIAKIDNRSCTDTPASVYGAARTANWRRSRLRGSWGSACQC